MKKNYTSWKDRYNEKYGYKKNASHTLDEISKDTGVSLKGLQQIYNKGVGAYKTNPSSVRPSVKSKEQWAMARVYSAVMGGKTSRIDAKELKMELGGNVGRGVVGESVTFYERTYADGTKQRFSVEEYEKNIYPLREKELKMELGGIRFEGGGLVNLNAFNKKMKTELKKSDYEHRETLDEKRKLIAFLYAREYYSKNNIIPLAEPDNETSIYWQRVAVKDKEYIIAIYLYFHDVYNPLKITEAFVKYYDDDYNELNNSDIRFEGGGQTEKQQNKIRKVMGEYKKGGLKTSTGKKVTDREQAIAIALSEAGVRQKMANGGLFGIFPDLTERERQQVADAYVQKMALGGEITQLEIDAMINYINSPNANPILINSYKKVLARFNVDIDNPKLSKRELGKYIDPYNFSGYEYMKSKNEELGVSFLLTGEYELVSEAIFNKDYSMWLFYNYLGRINISFKACEEWLQQAQDYFSYTMPIPIYLLHTPKAKDGRSYAMWTSVKESRLDEAQSRIGRPLRWSYDDRYYYNEIGMVANFDYQGGGWGTYYKERKTGLLIPEFTETSFHLNTLIHEFAHCLDFQSQLLENIEKLNNVQLAKDSGDIVIKTQELTELEKQLYGNSLDKKPETLAQPITNHFDYFVDSLIKVLRASASGNIPLTQVYEQQAIDVQTALSGVYGDLLLEQRERKRKEAEAMKREDEMRENKRFSWQSSYVEDIRDYVIEKSKTELREKVSKSNKTKPFTLTEILEFDNLINAYMEDVFKPFIVRYPSKAQSLLDGIRKMKTETNRIINNHYDNVINNFPYGFEPETELDLYLLNNCNTKDFSDYKSWKECAKENIGKKMP